MINSYFRFVVRKDYLRLSSIVIDIQLSVFARQVFLVQKRPKSPQPSTKISRNQSLILLINWERSSWRYLLIIPVSYKSRLCNSRSSSNMRKGERLSLTTVLPTSKRFLSSKRPPLPRCVVRPASLSLSRIRLHAPTVPGRSIVQIPKLQTVFGRFWGHTLLETAPSMECTNTCTSHLPWHIRLG